MEILRKVFRPEFLNRVDDFVFFNSLEKKHLKEIVHIQLDQVKKRLLEKKAALVFDSSAVDHFLKKGFDPAFGARPLKRAVQSQLLNPLSEQLIEGKITEGQTIKISANDLSLEFHPKAS